MSPEPGEVVELTTGSMVAGGDALARLADGRVVLVEGGLPGERVAVELTTVRRDHARARVREVLVAGPDRIEPLCPYVADGCGGCGWAHVREDRQPDLAQAVVADALRRIAGVADPPPPLAPDQVAAAGYRTTVDATVDGHGHLAYHRRHQPGSVAVETCRVAHPLVEDLLGSLRAPGWGSVTLRASVADGVRLAVLGGRRRHQPNRRGRDQRPAALTPGGPVEGPADVVVVRPGEDASIVEVVGGRRWRVSARSFFQSGPAAAEVLTSAVDGLVGDLPAGARLVDLYGGVGLLGGAVAARRDLLLTCVEADRSAVADARVNLADLAADVEATTVDRWTPTPADAVIADPARSGLGRPGVAAVAATGARSVVLVSCDPASFARDVALLAGAGYGLAAHRVLGLFPDTTHLEIVTRFECSD